MLNSSEDLVGVGDGSVLIMVLLEDVLVTVVMFRALMVVGTSLDGIDTL